MLRVSFKKNQVLNGVYPSHPLRGVALASLIIGLKKYKNIDTSFGLISIIQEKIPRSLFPQTEKRELAASIVFASGTWLVIVGVRKYSLQALFSYHGWMYEARGKTSLKTKMWCALIKVLIGSNPKLYSYQGSLPTLPVPSVKDTMTRVREAF